MTTCSHLHGHCGAQLQFQGFPIDLAFHSHIGIPEAGIVNPVLHVKCLCLLRSDTVTPDPAALTSGMARALLPSNIGDTKCI